MRLETNLNEIEFNQFASEYDLQSLGITYAQRDVVTLQNNTMVVDKRSSIDQCLDEVSQKELQYRLSLLIALKEKEVSYLLKNLGEDMKSQIINQLRDDIYTFFGDSIRGPLAFEEIRTLFQKLNCSVVFNNLKLEPTIIELIKKDYDDNYSNLPAKCPFKTLITLLSGIKFLSRSEINENFDLILKNLNKESPDSELCFLDHNQQ